MCVHVFVHVRHWKNWQNFASLDLMCVCTLSFSTAHTQPAQYMYYTIELPIAMCSDCYVYTVPYACKHDDRIHIYADIL